MLLDSPFPVKGWTNRSSPNPRFLRRPRHLHLTLLRLNFLTALLRGRQSLTVSPAPTL
jgi:hypothetical protein